MTRATVLAAGAVLVVMLASQASMTGSDTMVLAGVAAGGALVAGVLGLAMLRAAGTRPIRFQVVIVGLVTVVAMIVGIVAAAQAMFVSAHDLDALLVVVAAAGAVGIAAALTLATHIGEGTQALEHLADRIADGQAPPTTVPDGAPEELARLARRLADTAARLDESRGRERALESARRELVAWVSHDLRTPLAGIRALAEALDDGVVDDPAEVSRYHRTIVSEAERLAVLVDDLFELSRIEAAAIDLHLARVPLTDVVSDAVAAVAPAAGAKGVGVRGDIDHPGPVVDASEPELMRALRNLLDNAVRHTPAGQEVVVETGARNGHAYVAVTDACGGIPADDLARVFDVGFRGDPARSPAHADHGGGGLGLAIARGLVEAHHGDIAVRNAADGCQFTVRLPLAASR